MIHTLAANKTYHVVLDDATPVMVNTFNGAQSRDEFRAHIQHLTALYVTEAARRPGLSLIMDCSRMQPVDPDDMQWAAHYFVPRVASIGLRSLSIIEPLDITAQQGLDELAETVLVDFDVRIFNFKSMEQARSYLGVQLALTV